MKKETPKQVILRALNRKRTPFIPISSILEGELPAKTDAASSRA